MKLNLKCWKKRPSKISEDFKILEDLMTDHEHVGMVGDDLNDAPALARASTV